MANFSFQYLPVNCTTGWTPKARTWRTYTGAKKAAEKWERDMKDEGCEVATRIVEIIGSRVFIASGVPYATKSR